MTPLARLFLYSFSLSIVALTVPVPLMAQDCPVVKLPKDIDSQKAVVQRTRGDDPAAKLDANLLLLVKTLSPARDDRNADLKMSKEEVLKLYEINSTDGDPLVEVAIKTTAAIPETVLKATRTAVRFESEGMTFATVPVASLMQLAAASQVVSIEGMTGARIPEPPSKRPSEVLNSVGAIKGELDNVFNKRGLTGKGVIVGIVDTGIDWRHKDFIRQDGTSRILYLYDVTDRSWEMSEGKIGSKPPIVMGRRPWGTLYTNQQINDALSGKSTVNSYDTNGHGTACAGTAAGNGKATGKSVPQGTYVGVAPEADLIIVRAGVDSFPGEYHLAVRWLAETARQMKRPCVINLSLGTQVSAHDGSAIEEASINSLLGKDNPGTAICIAAGNERDMSFHAAVRFGPRRPGQVDVEGSPAELMARDTARVWGYFDKADDWGLAITGQDKFLVDKNGKPITFFVWKVGDTIRRSAVADGQDSYTGPLGPNLDITADSYFDNFVSWKASIPEEITFDLPAGHYFVSAFGPNTNIRTGRADLYIQNYEVASFGKGNESRYMVGTPGNAKNAITVGSYDFRDSWLNSEGKFTHFNLKTGEISGYSNPGYSRNESIKPDIVAPATFTISSLARLRDGKYSHMGSYPDMIAADGEHVSWMGTSAATPFVTGVIALLMEKNPKLTTDEIREILKKSARKDDFTGGVPNRDWGYGKINPEAAIKMTKR